MKNLLCVLLLCTNIGFTKAQVTTFTDPRDGKTYKTVKIGDQEWMAENLDYETKEGSWCYDDNSSNCEKYGRLYDWLTAKTVIPAGWHLPSKEEWEKLLNTVGGSEATTYSKIIQGGPSGFSALFGGRRLGSGRCDYLGSYADFWSLSECNSYFVWALDIDKDRQKPIIKYYFKNLAFSVRCVKD